MTIRLRRRFAVDRPGSRPLEGHRLETHITDITHVIQLAVAPVFLLTAIATLITALNNRLGRIVDRRRVVQDRLDHSGEKLAGSERELQQLSRRARLVYFAIFTAVLAALMVCL